MAGVCRIFYRFLFWKADPNGATKTETDFLAKVKSQWKNILEFALSNS